MYPGWHGECVSDCGCVYAGSGWLVVDGSAAGGGGFWHVIAVVVIIVRVAGRITY